MVGAEANQPVNTGEISAEDKKNATITQGLVLASGGAGALGALTALSWATVALSGMLGFLGLAASIGIIVVFFLWKDKGAFLHGHVRQALGLVLISIAVSIVIAILGTAFTAATVSRILLTGRMPVAVYVIRFVGLAINAVFAWFGYQGLQAAQRGESFEYPYVGSFIANFGKK